MKEKGEKNERFPVFGIQRADSLTSQADSEPVTSLAPPLL